MSAINDLRATVAALRDPQTGCPWDIEQDHQSLAECLIDECCELLQTIDRHDRDHMEEELGDVLLQVVMHAQIAAEDGDFDFDSVCREVNDKLIRRHPHVFGSAKAGDRDDVLEQWDAIKAAERKRGPKQTGNFKDLPRQLPALMFAQDIYKQIVKKDIPADDVIEVASIDRRAEELTGGEDDLGRELFILVAACRKRGLDPESALRRYGQNLIDTLDRREAARD